MGGGGGVSSNNDGMELELVFRGDAVDQEIDAENREAAMYIAREATAIKETMHDMKELLGEQNEKLVAVDKEIDETAVVVEKADQHIAEAAKHQQGKKKIIIITIVVVVAILLVGTAALLIYLATNTDIFNHH